MAKEVRISTVGMICPQPLIEARKALRKLEKGDVLIVDGDHKTSKEEIPLSMKDTGQEVLSVEENGLLWTIKIRK